MATQYGEDIAVLKDQMKDVKSGQDRMEGKLDVVLATYATKAELRTFKWVTIPIVIVVTAVLSALVAFYFQHNHDVTTGKTDTVTTTTPGGTSTSTTSGGTIPSANANASAKSDSTTPSDTQTSSSNGGVNVTLPKVLP